MSILEAGAVVLGFLAVWLTVRQDWRCWPVGLASVLAFAAVFWHARLYGAASLQLVYAVTQVYGWWAWRHGGARGAPLAVGRTPRRVLRALLLAGAASTVVVAAILGRTDAALPVTDAVTTSFSLVAQVLMTRKWIENWPIWIAVDSLYVVMYLSQSLHLTAALYAAFLALAWMGWREWGRAVGGAASGPGGDAPRTWRVVVIGPECTGKTTLAAGLAAHFGAPWVPEFARAFVERARRAVRYDDVEAIARGQQRAEDDARRGEPPFLVFDTDLVSTCVYSRHYYGDCPSWIEGAARARLADLYLLLATDVPWVAEGHLREQPERRDELHASFARTLKQWDARVVEVRGTWDERRATAVAAVDDLLSPQPAFAKRSLRSRLRRGKP